MKQMVADLLNQHLADRGWSFEKLAEEAGLPRNTVYRWTRAEVRKIRYWQDLVKAARALELPRFQTNAFLEVGGHPPLDALMARATSEEDQKLLSHWTLPSPPNNLPAHLTSFFGRDEELRQLSRLLASSRLVTLTGSGGSGKTRLALEAAHAVLEGFEGVFFIDLSAVRDPEQVIPAIARTLGLRESLDEPPLLALETSLRDQTILLMIDNLEQVIEAAPLLTHLLQAAPRVKALVTSRTRLHVGGEHEVVVPPLPLPPAASGFEELRRNPSVALFADRASAVDPSFTLTPESAPIVAELCTRLEGLPLSIELAAARSRQVRLDSMVERFPTRLGLASAGPRDAPDRQRTLQATIAWSYELLDRDARTLFACTSVFADGFTEEALGAVAAAIGDGQIDVPEGLESLVEQNLVRRTRGYDAEPRYEILESIREYALEKLVDCGEAETAWRAVTGYYLDLAQRAELEGGELAAWLRLLAAEQANFRAILGRCKASGQMTMGLTLSVALIPLWHLLDHQMEARSWLEAFMADANTDTGSVPPALRARGLLWQGLLLMRGIGDDASASRLFAEALALFREGGDLNGASETLQAEGDIYRNQEAWEQANQRYAESLRLAEQADNAYLAAHGWMGLALCAQEEAQFETAHQHWERTLAWAKQAENMASVALALNGPGEMARHRGDWDEAKRLYEQTLTLARELGNKWRIALALHNLGYVALSGGEPEQARRLFADGLSLYEERQYAKGMAECLAGLGAVEAVTGRLERAAWLCGAADALLQRLGTRLDALDRADYERTLECLRTQIGERLEALLDEGRALSMEDVLRLAHAENGPDSTR